MQKEFVDYIGSLLFGDGGNGTPGMTLQLKSERQYMVTPEGRLEKEQSVLTDIIVGKDAIYMTYRLPDGNTVSFVNAVREVEYRMNNDYIINAVIYKITGSSITKQGQDGELLFVLQCEDDDHWRLVEEMNMPVEGIVGKTFFEISC